MFDLQIRQLEAKVNAYLGFIYSGQINESDEYRGKPVECELHCQYVPPTRVEPVLRALKGHLAAQTIGWAVYIGPDRNYPVIL